VLLNVNAMLRGAGLDEVVRREEPGLDLHLGGTGARGAFLKLARLREVGIEAGHSRTNYATTS
jgi:hypothetical protein